MEMYYLSHRQARWVGDLELIESYVQLSVAGLFPHILLSVSFIHFPFDTVVSESSMLSWARPYPDREVRLGRNVVSRQMKVCMVVVAASKVRHRLRF